MASKNMVMIVGDYNDADYVTTNVEVTKKEQALIRKVAAAIKSKSAGRYGHNWDNSEYGNEADAPAEKYADLLTEDEILDFNDMFVPSGENGCGIHTIKSITFYVQVDPEELL